MLESQTKLNARVQSGASKTKVLERSLFGGMVLRMQTVADQDDRASMVKSFQVEGDPPPFIISHRSAFCVAFTELRRTMPERLALFPADGC